MMSDPEKNEDNSSENVVIKSRNIEDAKKTLTLNSKSGTQESNLDFSMKIEPKYDNDLISASNASLSQSRINDMYYGVSRQLIQKKNPQRSKDTLVRRIIFRNNNKDLTDSQILENPNEDKDMTTDPTDRDKFINIERRDSSTMRLRQMIALKQQSSKQFDEKDEKMIQKLKPYLNKFKITHGDGTFKNIKKISMGELERYNDSREVTINNNNDDITDVHHSHNIKKNEEEHTPLKERPQPRKSQDEHIKQIKNTEYLSNSHNYNKSNHRIKTSLNKNRENIASKIKRMSNVDNENKDVNESDIIINQPRIQK